MGNSHGHLLWSVRKFRKNTDEELREVFGKWVHLPTRIGEAKRKRLFYPSRTFWLFLSQVFSADGSCRETVRKFLSRLTLEGLQNVSCNTAGYTKARKRLDTGSIQRIGRQLARTCEREVDIKSLWHGRRVRVVDGSSISMPDTFQNQQAWPQPKKQKQGCGFPVMRIVVLCSLMTGTIISLVENKLSTHERTLFHALWKYLKPHDVLLADRGFCGYADIFFLLKKGVDCVMRNHQRRTVNLSLVKKIHKNDRLILWYKTNVCPQWIDHHTWVKMPVNILLREISFSVRTPGFRTKNVVLITTLLDHKAYFAATFVKLYRKRWAIELYLRDIKITMGMDILKCKIGKTPAMIRKELWMYVIAYNLIRRIMIDTAHAQAISIDRISVMGTISTIRHWAPILAHTENIKENRILYDRMLYYLAKDILPYRPNRSIRGTCT